MIHRYKQNGINIVLDVNSGGVHVVDGLTFDMLSLFDGQNVPSPEEIIVQFGNEGEECYREILDLIESGSLFSRDEYEQYATATASSPIKAMCLHVAHDCNLRCEYCFAAKGNFGGEAKLMPLETGKKAIDFLIKNSGKRRNLELDFFGGEPLMNFEMVKETVAYARALEKEHNKNFRFTITTNGLLLTDDKIEFINKEMSNVVLSIDGRKEINDRLRVKAGGQGSYDEIVPKYLKLVENRVGDYYVRGTFTKFNKDFGNDVFHMNDIGFEQISIEPVVSDSRLSYALTEEDLPDIFAEYEALAKRLIDHRKIDGHKPLNFFHFMIDLDNGPCAIKRLKGCGCGNEYVAVTPEGDIYPCHQFVGMEEWKMGTLDTGVVNPDMRTKFVNAHIYSKEECKNCWARFFCSGGCNANNYQYEGDILKPHTLSCELEKKRLECAIMMQAAFCE